MEGLKYSKIGYVFKIVGGFYALSPSLNMITNNVRLDTELDVERLVGAALIGGICYFIGDRMHRRELEEHRISLLENKLSADEKRCGATALSEKVTS